MLAFKSSAVFYRLKSIEFALCSKSSFRLCREGVTTFFSSSAQLSETRKTASVLKQLRKTANIRKQDPNTFINILHSHKIIKLAFLLTVYELSSIIWRQYRLMNCFD